MVAQKLAKRTVVAAGVVLYGDPIRIGNLRPGTRYPTKMTAQKLAQRNVAAVAQDHRVRTSRFRVTFPTAPMMIIYVSYPNNYIKMRFMMAILVGFLVLCYHEIEIFRWLQRGEKNTGKARE
jgi:hypothetical protein